MSGLRIQNPKVSGAHLLNHHLVMKVFGDTEKGDAPLPGAALRYSFFSDDPQRN